MEEKIKIYLAENTYNTIVKDIELFEILKKDGSLNVNKFLNKLVVNYLGTYEGDVSQNHKRLAEAILKHTNCDDITLETIIKEIDGRDSSTVRNKTDKVLSIKPTASSSGTIDYIQTHLLNDISLSGFFRNMLISYTTLPRNQRERIVFNANYELISKAIEDSKSIHIRLLGGKGYDVLPYALSSSNDELFNYLIAKNGSRIQSFRLSRIDSVVTQKNKFEMSNTDRNIVELINKYGVQYSFDREPETIVVRMSERGKTMYRRIYMNRPPYDRIDGDLYYFGCSRSQAKMYFTRLLNDAIIIEPRDLHDEMMEIISSSYRKYKNN